MERINCRRCVHFFVTWDRKMPYGCKAMDFKTNVMPSVRVYQTAGTECLLFEEKTVNKG